jgi:NAD(P)-dependent dehydrogenase (short-subunit alcohol dehydrogenase family)
LDSIVDKFDLKGKVVLITGAAGGIGTALSLAFARAGADIVATDIRAKENESLVTQVRESGGRALGIAADVTQSSQVEDMVKTSISEFGKIDILVNNAGPGRPGPQKPLWEVTDQEWHTAMDLILTSAFYCSRAVGKHMIESKTGKIINIASGWGLRARRFQYMYCTGKGGLIQLTKVLAITWARDGINVNCIAPGFIAVRHTNKDEEVELIQERGKLIPAGRAGYPEEVASLAVFLASEASEYMTGDVVILDGGALADAYAPVDYLSANFV